LVRTVVSSPSHRSGDAPIENFSTISSADPAPLDERAGRGARVVLARGSP
jgi:hypothetical protein